MKFYPILPRLPIFMVLLLVCVLSSCTSGPITTQSSQLQMLQLFDIHGTLICQLHGQNPKLDCLARNSVARQSAFQFIDYVMDELNHDPHIRATNLPTSGINISTTLDLTLQKQILQKSKQYIATMTSTHNITNAASVIIDYHNGAIRSLIGSLDSSTAYSPLNIVTLTPRQPGSVFKPFVYATAFEQDISPGEVIYDGPLSIATHLPYQSGNYVPRNYDNRFHGYMSYRSALQNNYNIPALKVFLRTGFAALKKTGLAMGLKSEELGQADAYSTPLGPVQAYLLNLTVAYGTMANGGVHIPPHTIDKISTSDGQTLYTTKIQRTQALSPATAFMLTDIMSDETAHTNDFGQCSPFQLYTTTQAQCLAGNPGVVRSAAVHNGVNAAFKDTMVIGYTSDFVVGTWTGNSDDSPMFNISGLDGASQIWHDSMLLAEDGRPIQPFAGPPTGVVKKTVAYPNLTTTDWYFAR